MRRAKGTIQVFTFKEGLLSAVAHDLQIHLDTFDITLDGDSVRGEFPLRSLNLIGPVEDGQVQPDRYNASKRADVHKAMNEDILHTDKHPTARFSGRAAPKGEGYSVSGELELAGQKGPLTFEVGKQGGSYTGEFENPAEPVGARAVPSHARRHPPQGPGQGPLLPDRPAMNRSRARRWLWRDRTIRSGLARLAHRPRTGGRRPPSGARTGHVADPLGTLSSRLSSLDRTDRTRPGRRPADRRHPGHPAPRTELRAR